MWYHLIASSQGEPHDKDALTQASQLRLSFVVVIDCNTTLSVPFLPHSFYPPPFLRSSSLFPGTSPFFNYTSLLRV